MASTVLLPLDGLLAAQPLHASHSGELLLRDMAAQMAGGEIVTLEIGPGGIQALEKLWAEDVQRDPFTEPKGRRRTMAIDAKRQPLRAVEDEDELVAAGHVDPTHVPLPLWAGAEALAGFSHFRAGTREGVLGGDWWEATLDHLRGTLERCDRAQGFVVATDAGGYAGVAHSFTNVCIGGVAAAGRAFV